MADKKISALTAATTPLAGTEVLPVVQSGATVKVAVSNLTAGRDVSASTLALNSAGPTLLTITGTTSNGYASLNLINSGGQTYAVGLGGPTESGLGLANSFYVYDGAVGQVRFTISSAGDATVKTGNLVIGTSGKGIDFSATPGTGTSELLADYEEGTWTPTQGSGLTVVGTFSSAGTYTKVGRTVFVTGTISATTSIVSAGGGAFVGGLPFASATNSIGTCGNAGYSSSTGVRTLPSNSFLYVVEGQAATTDMVFSITYQA
jgi:hypothetical protein